MVGIMGNLSNDTKLVILIIILLFFLLLLPNFFFDIEENIVKTESNIKTVRAGESVNFTLIFIRNGGFFDKEYKISYDEALPIRGEWNVSLNGTTIKVPPDSMKEFQFSINIPNDAEDGEDYYYQFTLTHSDMGGYSRSSVTFFVEIDNNITSELAEGQMYERSEHSSFQPSIFALIPIVGIIICIVLLIKLHRQTHAYSAKYKIKPNGRDLDTIQEEHFGYTKNKSLEPVRVIPQ
jgi:hypothetical protein